jgi:peptide-methionine (R)-S-oxide reductase
MESSVPLIPIYVVKTGMVELLPPVQKSDAQWRKLLIPESYHVARGQGTEYAYSGQYHATKEPGVYVCICCGTDLFLSDDKFDSGTGWPSFSRSVSDKNVKLVEDNSHGIKRTEVRCARCEAHLGHVFDDGPLPTGLRYCMNSLALKLVS